MRALDVVVASVFGSLTVTTALSFRFVEFSICLARGFYFFDYRFDFFFYFFALVSIFFFQIFAVAEGEVPVLRAEFVPEIAYGGAEVGFVCDVEAEGEERGADLVYICAFEITGFNGVDG